MKRLTENWRTTILGLVVLLIVGALIYTDKLHVDELADIVMIATGAGVGGILMGVKDPKAK